MYPTEQNCIPKFEMAAEHAIKCHKMLQKIRRFWEVSGGRLERGIEERSSMARGAEPRRNGCATVTFIRADNGKYGNLLGGLGSHFYPKF